MHRSICYERVSGFDQVMLKDDSAGDRAFSALYLD